MDVNAVTFATILMYLLIKKTSILYSSTAINKEKTFELIIITWQ